MTKEQLKELGIYDEVADKIVADYEANYVSKTDGAYIPKSRLDEVIGERDTYKTQVSDRDKQLKDLDKKLKDGNVEELQATITKLQEDNKAANEKYAAELTQIKTDNFIEKALTTAGAKNNTAVKALLADFLKDSKLNDKDEIEGLTDAIEKLKTAEDSSFMFTGTTKGNTLQGKTPDDPANKPDGKLDINNMSCEQFMAYANEHPEAIN